MLSDLWDSIEVYRVDPPFEVVLVTGLVALLCVTIDAVWRPARNVVTIVHEGGHAIAALLTGRRLTGIRLHSDTSGLTLSVGKPTGFGMIVTAAAGYLSPSLVGLIGVVLLAFGQVTVMLWAGLAVLAGMLVMIRNVYGVISLLVVGAVVLGVSLRADPDVQAAFGYGMTWFLLLGAVRPVTELQRHRRRTPGARSDADILARLTRLPAIVWVTIFGIVTFGAAAAGTYLLLTSGSA
jgi:Peptidase M50B-like